MRHVPGLLVCALTLFATTAVAAPMSGVFTVGGTSPSFATLQQAADSLLARGVSGPVQIRLRPGVYMKDGGTDRALFLSDPIPGSTAERPVTFSPDSSAGGNVDNVVIAVDKTVENGVGAVEVRADNIRFRHLTFADRDSGQAGARYLLLFAGTPGPANPFLEGLEVDGCKFIGSPVNSSAFQLVTDFGISGSDDDVQGLVVARCTFTRLLRPLDVSGQDTGDVAGTIVIEANSIERNHNALTGTGNQMGLGIFVAGRNVTVRDNLVDFADGSGFGGILARIHDTGVVERNYVKNGSTHPFIGIQVEDFFFHDSDSVTVANNMVSGIVSGQMTGIAILSRRTLVAHNTVVLIALEGGHDKCLSLDAQDCRLRGNILDLRGNATTGFHWVFQMFGSSSATLVSDFNVFNKEPAGHLVLDGGTFHPSLASWQAASGQDGASFVRALDFVNLAQDVHLTDCQSQDPALQAEPLPAVSLDFDGQPRSRWMRGADEAFAIEPRLFEPFRIGLAGTPFAVDAAPFDDPLADGMAVPDYDNNAVHLFHNLPASRAFTPAGSLGVPFQPTCARFMDLDVDGHADLIVGGEAAAVVVFWGNGTGGLPDSTVVPTSGRVVSIEPQPSAVPLVQVCLLAEDNGFLPDRSFLGVLAHQGGRSLCHDLVQKGSGLGTDTLATTLKDIAAANFSPDPGFEIVGIGLGPGLVGKLVAFTDFEVATGVFTECDDVFFTDDHTVTPAPVASYGGNNANIAHGDYDGDGDVDMVTTGFTSSQIVLLRNNGAMGFTPATLDANDAVAVVALDYDGDSDLDVVSINRQFESNGLALYRNDGTGTFTRSLNCFQGFGTGSPFGATTGDFDLDGRTDIAVVTSFDSLFVLYNTGATAVGVPGSPVASGPGPVLAPCMPNPVVGAARIGFTLPARTHVRVALFDMQGRRMATLVNEVLDAGPHETRFVPGSLPSGVYLCRLEAGGIGRSRKLMVVR